MALVTAGAVSLRIFHPPIVEECSDVLMRLLTLSVLLRGAVCVVVVSAAGVILAARAGSVVDAVLAGVLFLLNLWYVYSVRHKIPFAAAMMDVSLRLSLIHI